MSGPLDDPSIIHSIKARLIPAASRLTRINVGGSDTEIKEPHEAPSHANTCACSFTQTTSPFPVIKQIWTASTLPRSPILQITNNIVVNANKPSAIVDVVDTVSRHHKQMLQLSNFLNDTRGERSSHWNHSLFTLTRLIVSWVHVRLRWVPLLSSHIAQACYIHNEPTNRCRDDSLPSRLATETDLNPWSS